jgi:hypothetical protein
MPREAIETDALVFILVNEMREAEEVVSRLRVIVKEIGERSGVRYDLSRSSER